MARKAKSTEDQDVKKSAFDLEMERIETDYGKGTIISNGFHQGNIEVISTGSLGLDYATGIWGLPRGKVVEIMGWESSGKSTIVQQTIGNAQKMGLRALYIDGENSFDAGYATALGVDCNSLLIEQLDEGGGEKCYNVAERLIRTKELGICVIDSQTSLLPKKVLEGEVGDSAIGLHARMMSAAVPKLMNAAMVGNCLLIFISQFREKIGVMFGSPETTNGGNALKFYAHMRIRVGKSILKKGDEVYGNETRCKVAKNKLAVPFKEAEFNIIFGKGVDRREEIINFGSDLGILVKAGSWYSYQDSPIGQGKEGVKQFFLDNPEVEKDIENQVINKLKQENNGDGNSDIILSGSGQVEGNDQGSADSSTGEGTGNREVES